MPLSLGSLLERIRARDWAVAEELTAHGLDGSVGALERLECDEAEAARVSGLWVAHNLGGGGDDPKSREGVVQQLLVYIWVQVAHKDVCANVEVLLVARCGIDADGFAVEFDHVEHLDGVL